MRGSIHAKVFAVIAVIAIALSLGLASFFTGRYVDATHRELDERLRIYSQLAARELIPVLESNDDLTLHAIFNSLAADEELSAIAVYREDGTLVGSYGSIDNDGSKSKKRIAAVIQGRRTRGTVVIEMSTALVEAEIAQANRATLLVTALARLTLALFGAWPASSAAISRSDSAASRAWPRRVVVKNAGAWKAPRRSPMNCA